MGTANPFYKKQALTHKAESSLFTHTLNRIELSGFEHFLFLMAPPNKNTHSDSLFLTNYPNEFIESFKASSLIHENPIEKHCKTSISPLIWDQTLFNEAPRLWESSQLHGLNYGWSFSIHDAKGVVSILSMTRRNAAITPQESSDKVANLLWLCHELHSALQDTVQARVKINETIGRLSQRESEILNWTAKGKTASDIAMILSLTTRTVNFHISSAIRKMGASNKTAAVVTAAKCGLI
ncbi:LuxR family transcriptional regulator [Pseudomonas sp. CCC3.1]|uniref:LuxR family transcriptional regulator n=1 Tax=Pseudomonas sp. CCC3.1 TaxID=3048607 RepID=UPI002AC8C575|nr:LuxR family transcriptional regulator [Pseudomonas sp. CCC3.1]MEB0206727.1 LuxR family transcriptional regulator [Pseudomonas sp. CCC3.1]WPX36843.1 LuxR family transcriptional regulator [Pseudomonas sp. CCC3.1]